MSKMQKKNLSQPDEKRTFEKGQVETVSLGGVTFGRATLQPGWKWSTCVKPLAKTQSCQAPHLQYHVSGRLHVVMDDGSKDEFEPGDVSSLPRGTMPGLSAMNRSSSSTSAGWRITPSRSEMVWRYLQRQSRCMSWVTS